MKKFLSVVILGTLLLTGCSLKTGRTNLIGFDSQLITISQYSDTSEIASAVEPAIVGISGVGKSGDSVGSGVCVSSNGYILTNSHVVNGCKDIVLYLSNATQGGASIVYEDTVMDLAILKSNTPLPYLKIGSSDEVSVGDDILAVGTPLSLSLTHTFTKGIVSAVNRTLKVSGKSGEGYMQNLIQHDASLNPGNSGGPLLNEKGEVVGINTLKISGGEGIGFAIPSKSFITLLESYIEDANYEVPYLGVYGYDSQIANYYDKTVCGEGFYVVDISANSPLNACGIKPGSVITSINNNSISNALDLRYQLYKLKNGEIISIGFVDNRDEYRTKVKLYQS